MKAMILTQIGQPLELVELEVPRPGPDQLLVQVHTCGVCRTDLHIVDGELPDNSLPVIPGHEVVGHVEEIGVNVDTQLLGQRVGVPWLGSTCNTCWYCKNNLENLCDNPGFTGYTLNGGYAEYLVADNQYCLPIPQAFGDQHAAPLLCAGLIGFRSLRSAGEGENLGIYGFGAAAHIVAQIAKFEGRRVFAFTRPGDLKAQEFALGLNADWAGNSDSLPPRELDAAIIFAPVGSLLPQALKAVRKGGTVVCGGIHMSDIPTFSYDLLWGERTVKSVANLTRQDGLDFFELAPKVPVETHIELLALEEANEALRMLRQGELSGAAVLQVQSETYN